MESQIAEAKEPDSIENDLVLEEIDIQPDIAEKRDDDAGFPLEMMIKMMKKLSLNQIKLMKRLYH